MKEVPKLGVIAIAILFAGAALGDLITLIPLTGWFVAPIFWTCVSLSLWVKGFGFINARRLVTMLTSLVIGCIPGLEALPELCLGIAVLVFVIKAQEKTGISVGSLASGKVGVGQFKQAVLNSGGSRMPAPIEPANIDGVRAPGGGLS